MAVTFTQQPNDYTQSDNQVLFRFASDQSSQVNFSFVIITKVNGQIISERNVLPIQGGEAYFDAVIDSSNSTIPTQLNNSLIYDANNYVDLVVEIKERYGATPTTQPTIYTSNTIIVWKSKISNFDFSFYNPTFIDNKFITLYNFTRKVRQNEQLRFLIANKKADFDLKIKLFKADGNLINSVTVNKISDSEFTVLNLTPKTIVENTSITLLNMLGAYYYTIECDNGYDVPETRIDVNFDCKQKTGRRLHWISQIGSIESFSFDLVSKHKGQIESFGFKKQYFKNPFNEYLEGEDVDTVKKMTSSITLNSNWLSDIEHSMIVNDLFLSPSVWIEELDGNVLRRVKISNTSFESKNIENDMLFKEEIEIVLETKTSMII